MIIGGTRTSVPLLLLLGFLRLSSAKSTLPIPLLLEFFKINTIQNSFAVSHIMLSLITSGESTFSVLDTGAVGNRDADGTSNSYAALINLITFGESTFNVIDTGAIGDGHADDTPAFIEAWNQACSSAGKSNIIIPEGKSFLVQPTTFAGKCNSSHINIVLAGTIMAPEDSEAWKGREVESWLVFQDVNGLTISGGGVLNGRGRRYHPGPSLTISRCQNVELSQIVSTRSGGQHFNIYGSQNVTVQSVTIKNSKESPTTDVIYLAHPRNDSQNQLQY